MEMKRDDELNELCSSCGSDCLKMVDEKKNIGESC